MSRFNTGNPLGSDDPRDLDDNAKNMDLAVNSDELSWSDRFGRDRKSFEGMEREFSADQSRRESEFDAGQAVRENEFESAQNSREVRFNDFISASGYQFLGDYAAGLEFTEYNQLVRDENGEFWRLSGQVELPYVTTGAGIPEDDALVPAGDAVIRQDLSNPDKGAAMVARAPICVETVEDLLLLSPGQRKSGTTYNVKSYLTPRNYLTNPYSGGGSFEWHAGSTETPDGVLVFGDGAVGRFVRIVDSTVPQDIAAAGYDYGSTEPQGDRVQSALDAFQKVTTEPGARVYIGDSELVVPNTCTLAMGDGSYFVSSTLGTAVTVKAGKRDASGVPNLRTLKRTTVISVWRSSLDWTSGEDTTSRGIVIEDNRYSTYVLSAQNFLENVVLSSDRSRQLADGEIWNGIVGCDFHFPMVRNGKINLKFETPDVMDSGTGYINQNNFPSGTLRHDSNLLGQDTINIDLSTGNGNTFIGLNLEGNSARIAQIRFTNNTLLNCRYEGTNIGDIHFIQGGTCRGNVFLGGYGATELQRFTGDVGSQIIFSYRGSSLQGSFNTPALSLWAESSATAKALSVKDFNSRIRMELGGVGVFEGYGADGKQTDDNPGGRAHPSILINPSDRSISLGSGLISPSEACRLREESGRLHLYGITTLRPQSDNEVSLGSASGRWSQVYAGTGTINTSDAREKQQIRSLDEEERAVALRLKSLVKAFKFNDAVERKGSNGARIHFGWIAQEVKGAFEAEGLVAEDYAVLCFDEWGGQPEEKDEDGNITQEAIEAGGRYGIRYEELMAFILSVL